MLDPSTKQWIADSAVHAIPAEFYEPDEFRFQLIHAEDREVYRIDVPGWNQFLVLKIWCTDEHGHSLKKTSDSIRDEYDKTRLAHQAWSKSPRESLSMAEPVAVSESLNAVLLTGCAGDDFSKYLNKHSFSWPFKWQALQRRFRLAGTWLGSFHSGSVNVQDDQQFVAMRMKNLTRMLGAMDDHDLLPDVRSAIESRIDLGLRSGDALPIVLIHGNFALRNLLVNDESISAIDFEECRQECAAYDVGQFVAEILVRGFIPTLPRSIVQRFVREFLAGYEVEFELESELLDAYVGYHLVAFYFEHVRRRSLNAISRLRRDHIKREIIRWMGNSERHE